MQIFFIESVEEFLKSNSIPFARRGNTISFEAPNLPTLILVPLNEAATDAAQESEENLGSVIYLYEDRWRSTPQITGKRLLAHLGHFQRIHARLCKVVTLENCKKFSITPTQFNEKVRAFLNKYHPYGYLKCDFPYAFLYKENIVAAGSFSGTGKNGFEWTRHATLPEVRIPGGMGKALEAFVQNRKKEGTLRFEVMSYSDNEWSNGEVYKTLGFNEEEGLPPITYHVDPATFQRLNYRRWQQAIGKSSSNDFITIKNRGSRKWKKYFNFTL